MASAAPAHPFLEPSPPDASGEIGRLGHYRVIRQMGQGGMGFVFEAEDIKLKRLVALKVMNQKIAATPGAQARFLSEARAMAAVHHDNVATIFEVGQEGETPFMAMEMLSGQTIEDLNRDIKKGKVAKPDFGEIIRIGQQVCWGLDAAHKRGIVHRDIKPANLWIETENERIKVLDFGLALAQTPVDSFAGRGSVIGTPGYLSPEQARGEPLDDRSDLYSLGVVLFELCTQDLPIRSKSIHQQLIAILIQKPALASELNADIPPPLAETIAKLLRKEPRSRFRSAGELATHFDTVRRQCERTSEVALTIDKLKLTLESVASESAPKMSLDAIQPGPVNDFGDLSSLDDALSQLPSSSGIGLTSGSGIGAFDPLGGSSGSIPVIKTLPTAAKPAAAGKPRPAGGSKDRGDSKMHLYIPIAIVVALLLVALPVMTFVFSSMGRSNETVLIVPSGADIDKIRSGAKSSTKPNSGAKTSVPENKTPRQKPAEKQVKRQAEKALADNSPGGDSVGDSSASSSASSSKNSSSGSPVDRDVSPVAINRSSTPPDETDPAITNSSLAGTTSGRATPEPKTPDTMTAEATPDVTDRETSKPESPKLRKLTISTGMARGSDAVVVRGTNQNKGEDASIAIQTRGDVPTRHSYLRFDLESLGKNRDKVRYARLVLHPARPERPVGANIELYAIDMKPIWPEDGINWNNSFSENGLDNLAKVATINVTGDTDDPPIVTLGSEDLAEFIRTSKNETITFVLAGKHDDATVRFMSHERSRDQAPMLQLAIEE